MDLFFNFFGLLKSGVSCDFFSVASFKAPVFISVVFFGAILLCGMPKLFANNASVSSVEIVDEDSSAKTAKIQFNLSWENSWRDSVNHDATWVFFKYSTDAGVTWNHATMKTSGTNPSGFSYGTRSSGAFNSLDMIVPTDKKGVFVEPAHLGNGSLNFTGLKVVWDYGADGVSDPYSAWNTINGSTRIKAIAIEMTYVPTEGFYLGDGSAAYRFYANNSGVPGAINGEQAMDFGNSATQWYYLVSGVGGDDVSSGAAFQVGEAFPKGFHAFYAMKYEITEGQYVDFLNSLLRPMQNRRVAVDVSADSPAMALTYVMSSAGSVTYRNTIQCPGSGNGTTNPIVFTTDRPDRAASYLSWMDLAAYADWSGLRPMTELEYEKMGRGPIYPVGVEYAWGSTSINACTGISGSEDGTEYCSNGAGYQIDMGSNTFSGGDGGVGPVRAGFFATSSTTTRLDSGAGYYGNMELSGNILEWVVSVGHAKGRGFSGTHGDGYLVGLSNFSYSGNATNPDWPGLDNTPSYGITGGAGSGWRGGSFEYSIDVTQLSNRAHAAYGASNGGDRYIDTGGRCVRTAPDENS